MQSHPYNARGGQVGLGFQPWEFSEESNDMDHGSKSVVVVGAGPAGLTAARELQRRGISQVTVVESSDQVGGISRTESRNGWKFDIGGHRFFTKVARVEQFWHEVLTEDDFLLRPRMSRIFYKGKFFDYPLRAGNALRNLGIRESILCVASYVMARIRPPRDQTSFESWVAARFGWRLYRTFFKTYTEKVWGVPANSIQADWAAQRIKNLSLGKAVWHALLPSRRRSTEVTSLIEEFQYPKHGPGMMWERCAEQFVEAGGEVLMERHVSGIARHDNKIQVRLGHGLAVECTDVISSMAISDLVFSFDPAPPKVVVDAAARLRYRDFLTVALVVPEDDAFPDNWIYVHSPDVRVGRVQNYGSWSPFMVKEGRTCLGMEYFVSVGDDLWSMDDDRLVKFATRELESLELIGVDQVQEGYVVRYPRTYPVYDSDYAESLGLIRSYLEESWPEIHPVGRNGMHRYNNQDHSMLTAMLTVENIALGSSHDVWEVNVDKEYHEESRNSSGPIGTGRSAPKVT